MQGGGGVTLKNMRLYKYFFMQINALADTVPNDRHVFFQTNDRKMAKLLFF